MRKLPRDIWALGFVSLFMDISSETIHALLPLFLVSVLGASLTVIGVLEGAAEAVVLILKVFSGVVSDWFGRRKPLVLLGYAMATLSKPLFALAGNVGMVFGARLIDRVGKGIREAPRDALIADLAPPDLRGLAFGLRQSLDTVGAFIGPILAILLMIWTGNNYRQIFWLATIPGMIAVGVLFFGVKEKEEKKESVGKKISLQDLKTFSTSFWFVAATGALIQLSRFSEAFLILRAKDSGLQFKFIPLVLIVMNIVYALASYFAGNLSDRMRKEKFLPLGLLVLCIADLVLGFGGNLLVIFFGVILWGLHMGLTQGILAALVADTAPPERRGTAYGIFNIFSAAALLLASITAGMLWDKFGPKATFFVGATVSFLSLLVFLKEKWRFER